VSNGLPYRLIKYPNAYWHLCSLVCIHTFCCVDSYLCLLACVCVIMCNLGFCKYWQNTGRSCLWSLVLVIPSFLFTLQLTSCNSSKMIVLWCYSGAGHINQLNTFQGAPHVYVQEILRGTILRRHRTLLHNWECSLSRQESCHRINEKGKNVISNIGIDQFFAKNEIFPAVRKGEISSYGSAEFVNYKINIVLHIPYSQKFL